MRKRLALASGLLWALLSTPSARAHDDDHGIELFLSNTDSMFAGRAANYDFVELSYRR